MVEEAGKAWETDHSHFLNVVLSGWRRKAKTCLRWMPGL